MVKSSEVLRLAAEYAIIGQWESLYSAAIKFKYRKLAARNYADMCGWPFTIKGSEHEVMVLCLAAAIAESDGD